MTALFQCRIDERVLKKADRVAKRFGTSTSEIVRSVVAEMARTGKVPVSEDSRDEDGIAGPWAERSERIESFYCPSKTW